MKLASRTNNITLILIALIVLSSFILSFTSINTKKVSAQAAACGNMPTTLGLATKNISLPSGNGYSVWLRLKSPDGAPTLSLSIDGAGGSFCNQTISTNGANDTWLWVKSTSQFNWSSASEARVQLSGTKAEVGLDCVVVTRDGAFNPSGASGCAQPPDTINPTISITAPTNGSTISATTKITANANDDVAVKDVKFFVNGTQIGNTDATAPYEVDWNTFTVADGTHTLTAIVTDTSNNSVTSNGVSVTVDNNPVPPNQADLQARWKFNEGSGLTAYDSTGNNQNGNLVGSPTWINGVENNALQFNGSSSRVELGGLNVNANAFTISAWINPSSSASDPRIFSKAIGTAEQDHTLMLSLLSSGGANNQLRLRLKTGGTTSTLIATAEGTVPLNAWSHVTATYDGATMKLYLNGINVGSVAKTGLVNQSTVNTWIGGNPNGSNFFTGKIDDVQLYTKALNELEIVALANGSEPTGSTPDTTPPVVSITAPANAQTVSGTITIKSDATDNIGVARVAYFLDGSSTAFSEDTTSPYETTWNSASVANGSHTLLAKAYDLSGNEASSQTITFNVNNTIQDTQKPTTSITNPTNNSTVQGVVVIQANASDNVGVSKVELLINGALVATDLTSPFSFSWDTTNVVDGPYALSTRAYDAANNSATSTTVTVNVANPPQLCEDETAINVNEPLPCRYEIRKTGDINNDGKVDVFDLSRLLANWNKTTNSYDDGDVNDDGVINVFDLSIVLANWGA